ncbi:hypothetical protein GGF46_000123 [Coemansia sp. RSA 552]|nr:hypothetical protein GGF46_000123 [Coemansia sp. RSA 552]
MAEDGATSRAATPKLPLNARVPSAAAPQQQHRKPTAVPIAIAPSSRTGRAGGSSSLARSANAYLLSGSASAYLLGGGSDSDSTKSSKQRGTTIERAEAARLLRQHLVTRPATGDGGSGGPASSGHQRLVHSFNPAAAGDGQRQAHSFNTMQPIGPAAHAGLGRGKSASPGATSPGCELATWPADEGGYAADINEDDEVVADRLQLAAGDTVHQIYRWHAGAAIASDPAAAAAAAGAGGNGAGRRRRRQSFSGWDSDSEWEVPLRPGQINVPGGFRRQFVRQRAERQGREPPGFIAESFIDFIALYGHFAGGSYLGDDDKEYFDAVHAAAPEPDERTPLRRVPSGLQAAASSRKAFFLLIKAFVGTGVLVLPRAFYNGGLLTACLLMIVVAWYAWHCILLLADVYQKVGGGSYSDIGLRLYGRWMQYAVISSIVLAQIGGCCAYTIFVAQNWRNVFDTLSACRMQLPTEFWVLVQALVFVPLALIRQIRYFAPVALVANVLIIASLAYLLGFDLWSISVHGPAPFANYNPARFPLLVGTAVYSFEGITLVIPILESLRDKHCFARVLTLAISLCLGLFLCVGSLSYLTFGESVEAVVLLNLPNSSSWTLTVQLLYSVAILFSMPLQLFPAVKIMEAMMFTRSGRDFAVVKWQKNLFRTSMALFIAMIAIFGADQLDNVVSLVGSFCLVPLSFIYPSSMHLKAVAQTRAVWIKDMVLLLVGVVAMVYVTYISIRTWGSSNPPLDVCASGA